MYPDNYLYSKEHEWISLEDGIATLGITQFAQEELGEVVYLELPDVGDSFAAGDEIGTIESVKAVADLYAPVTGEVVEVNADLTDAPEQVNEDCYGDGWLIVVKVDADQGGYGQLLDAKAYAQFLKERAD